MVPTSPQGQMLAHVLSSEPHLFTAAVEATLDRLGDELEEDEGKSEGASESVRPALNWIANLVNLDK
jgi:hypothetical protein